MHLYDVMFLFPGNEAARCFPLRSFSPASSSLLKIFHDESVRKCPFSTDPPELRLLVSPITQTQE